jgi:hypothetical protein
MEMEMQMEMGVESAAVCLSGGPLMGRVDGSAAAVE